VKSIGIDVPLRHQPSHHVKASRGDKTANHHPEEKFLIGFAGAVND